MGEVLGFMNYDSFYVGLLEGHRIHWQPGVLSRKVSQTGRMLYFSNDVICVCYICIDCDKKIHKKGYYLLANDRIYLTSDSLLTILLETKYQDW